MLSAWIPLNPLTYTGDIYAKILASLNFSWDFFINNIDTFVFIKVLSFYKSHKCFLAAAAWQTAT